MAAEAQPEERDRHQVQPNHAEIERMQANRHCLSIAARRIEKDLTPIYTGEHRLETVLVFINKNVSIRFRSIQSVLIGAKSFVCERVAYDCLR
jgi:hypothetical protein